MDRQASLTLNVLVMVLLSCDVAYAQRVQPSVHLSRQTEAGVRGGATGEGVDPLALNQAAGETHVSTIVVAQVRAVPIGAKDNRGRNALIGAVIGGGLVGAYYLRDCYRNDCYWPLAALYPAAIGAGVGAFVGILVTPRPEER
jgi:hypothetical protein